MYVVVFTKVLLHFPPPFADPNTEVWLGLNNPDGVTCDDAAACNDMLEWSNGDTYKRWALPDLGVRFNGGHAHGRWEPLGGGDYQINDLQDSNTFAALCEFTCD